MMKSRRFTFICACAVALASSSAWAGPINPGFDGFRSLSGTGIDLPGIGFIPLRGDPFEFLLGGPSFFKENPDTVIERLQGIDPFEPPGGTGTIDIEIVALHLTSIKPIDLTIFGIPFEFGDLHITKNQGGVVPSLPDDLPGLLDSLGDMEITHDHDNGGTFESSLSVNANLFITVVGGDPSNAADVIFSQHADTLELPGVGTWEHSPFTDFQVMSLDHDGPHIVDPIMIIPAPGAITLLVLGGLFRSRRRSS